MSQRSSQKSRNSDNVERRKSARLASNRIIDEITIGTTSADSAHSADNESEIELIYEAPASQKKPKKTPAKKLETSKRPSQNASPARPAPSTSRAMTAGEMMVRQQMLEESITPSPAPSSNRSTQQSRATPRRTPAKRKQPRLPPDWVMDRIKQRNLRLEEIQGVVDAEEEIQFIVKWRKLPQPERIGFVDLRHAFPKETLRFLLSKMVVKSKAEFRRFVAMVEQSA